MFTQAEQITGGWHPAGVRQRQRARAWVSNFAKICLSTGKCQKTIAKTKKTKKTKKKLEIWPGGARDARLISSIFFCFFGFFGFSNGFLQFPALSPPAPKGQGLGFTMARKQKAWHSWIHIGKRIAWNNLWSGALDSCVYRTNHWGVASCRGPPAPKGQGLGFTVARKQKAWHSWIHIGKRVAWNNL